MSKCYVSSQVGRSCACMRARPLLYKIFKFGVFTLASPIQTKSLVRPSFWREADAPLALTDAVSLGLDPNTGGLLLVTGSAMVFKVRLEMLVSDNGGSTYYPHLDYYDAAPTPPEAISAYSEYASDGFERFFSSCLHEHRPHHCLNFQSISHSDVRNRTWYRAKSTQT